VLLLLGVPWSTRGLAPSSRGEWVIVSGSRVPSALVYVKWRCILGTSSALGWPPTLLPSPPALHLLIIPLLSRVLRVSVCLLLPTPSRVVVYPLFQLRFFFLRNFSGAMRVANWIGHLAIKTEIDLAVAQLRRKGAWLGARGQVSRVVSAKQSELLPPES